MKVEQYIHEKIAKQGAMLFCLIDPLDYPSLEEAIKAGVASAKGGADIILVGGSMGVQGEALDRVVKGIKEEVSVPLVLFPGNITTFSKYADAVYFMSMLNSRNPYWITGAQTLAAGEVAKSKVEALPVGYIVVEPGGTVGWVGDAKLIPRGKPKVAAALALAGQCMGFRMILTDAGSAPKEGHIPEEMVRVVAGVLKVPYIVGGGVRTPEQARRVIAAGADAIQVGTALEEGGSVEGKVKELKKAVLEGAKERKFKKF